MARSWRGTWAHCWVQDQAWLAAGWQLPRGFSQHLPEAGAVVWALAVLSLPFLFLLLLTPARPFAASWGRILTAVTMSPCKVSRLQDPNGWRRWQGMELGCRRGGGGTPSPSLPQFPHSHSTLCLRAWPKPPTRRDPARGGRDGAFWGGNPSFWRPSAPRAPRCRQPSQTQIPDIFFLFPLQPRNSYFMGGESESRQ